MDTLALLAKILDKPTAKFTAKDWQQAAVVLARILDRYGDELPSDRPIEELVSDEFASATPEQQRRRGRPTKYGVNMMLKWHLEAKRRSGRPRGRPKATKDLIDIADVSQMADEVMKPEMYARWPDLPRTRKGVIQKIVVALGGSPVWVKSVVRRERAYRQQRK